MCKRALRQYSSSELWRDQHKANSWHIFQTLKCYLSWKRVVVLASILRGKFKCLKKKKNAKKKILYDGGMVIYSFLSDCYSSMATFYEFLCVYIQNFFFKKF